MIAEEVIELVRDEISDDIEDYRWSDAKMLSALTDACFELGQDRPDLLLESDGTYDTVETVSHIKDVLVFGDAQRMPLVHYTAYRILSKDSEDDTNMKLAGFHLNEYNRLI